MWDFDDPVVADYYTAWRRCVRRVWGIPSRTHCDLLSGICNDGGVESQLLSRSIKFLETAFCSSNSVLRLCAELVVEGSRSALSNTLSLVCGKLNISRHAATRGPVFPRSPVGPVHGAIRDFALARHMARGDERENINTILIALCTG